MKQKLANLPDESSIQSAMDDNIERNIQPNNAGRPSSQVILSGQIQEHLRELDRISDKEIAGSKVIVAETQKHVKNTITGHHTRVEKCGLGGEDWLVLGTTSSERERARRRAA